MRPNLWTFFSFFFFFFPWRNRRWSTESLVVKRKKPWTDVGSGGRDVEHLGFQTRTMGYGFPAWLRLSRLREGILRRHQRRREKARSLFRRGNGVNRLTSPFSQSWSRRFGLFFLVAGKPFPPRPRSFHYGGRREARAHPAAAHGFANWLAWEGRSQAFSVPPRGPALAGVHAPRPARRGRLLANMIASEFVLGLVLRLFLQAHVSAGEAAALGPTPAHPSACEDRDSASSAGPPPAPASLGWERMPWQEPGSTAQA